MTLAGLNKPRGALVADVLPKGPAAKSDLRPGDIVVEYEGKPIDRSSDLPALVGLSMPGTHARFRVFRRDQGMQNVVVTLGAGSIGTVGGRLLRELER